LTAGGSQATALRVKAPKVMLAHHSPEKGKINLFVHAMNTGISRVYTRLIPAAQDRVHKDLFKGIWPVNLAIWRPLTICLSHTRLWSRSSSIRCRFQLVLRGGLYG